MQRYVEHCGLFLPYQRIFIITFHSIPHFPHYHFQLFFLQRFLKPKAKTLPPQVHFHFLAFFLLLKHLPKGRGQQKTGLCGENSQEDCGGYMGRLRRLYGKIAEVIWAFGLEFFHITSAIFPYNLCNLLGNFSHIIPFFF